MLPMITVSGTRSNRRFSAMWDRAAAPSQWWQNPTLSFGPGYPQYVPSTSALVDPGPVVANPTARATRPRRARGACYKSASGSCKAGYTKMGYDRGHNAICCPGKTGPLVRNPPPPPTPYEDCRAFCYDHPEIKHCVSKHCAWLKDIEPKGSASPGRRRARLRSSSSRRAKARAIARSARAMVSVGHVMVEHHHHVHGHEGPFPHEPEWKKAGACCQSCHEGNACEGGCGSACTCGKEGPSANPRLRARRGRIRRVRRGGFRPSRMRPETLKDCLYLCGPTGTPGRAKCRQDCFHKHPGTR
jgi:hypothetical protein